MTLGRLSTPPGVPAPNSRTSPSPEDGETRMFQNRYPWRRLSRRPSSGIPSLLISAVSSSEWTAHWLRKNHPAVELFAHEPLVSSVLTILVPLGSPSASLSSLVG